MKGFFLNINKFLRLDISSDITSKTKNKILRNRWHTFKADCILNKVKITYLILDAFLSFIFAYILVDFVPISNDNRAYIGFSIFYIAFSILMIPMLYNVLMTIVLFFSSIFGKSEAKTENAANTTSFKMRNKVIPFNHYLFTFISVYFPSFIILFCMKYSGIHWNSVYYMCATFIIAFFEVEAISIGSYLLLEYTTKKASCYNLKYNTLKKGEMQS